MVVKIYTALWAMIFLAAAALFAVGSFTMVTAVVFGFIMFGMTFMGIMVVLPITISHPTVKLAHVDPKMRSSFPIRRQGFLSQVKTAWNNDDAAIKKPETH